MTLIVDASVAVKWVLDEPGSAEARSLLLEPLAAADLWLSEAANTLWKRARRKELRLDEAKEAFNILIGSPVKALPAPVDALAALRLSVALDHSAYDCLYLAAAVRLNIEVVTADARFARAVSGTPHAAPVRLL